MSDHNEHAAFMQRALQLAARGRRLVNPNPMVGAVIVKDGRVVGEGYHQRFGEAHAEINAIRDAGAMTRGATMYVTLEPCCHYGKTPPCTEAIVNAGISRVVIGMLDPNPLVQGKGVQALRQHFVEVITDIACPECEQLNEVFIKYISTGMPFVTLKIAQTLDGRIATRNGHSKWITSTAARAQVHKFRCEHDAVLVGIGTVLADNPRLTIRHVAGEQPIRIVLDSNLRIPLNSYLLNDAHTAHTLIATTKLHSPATEHIETSGASVLQVEADSSGKISLPHLLRAMANMQISSVLVEGGTAVFTSFLRQKLADRLVVMIAPKILGQGIEAIGNLNIEHINQSYQLTRPIVRVVAPDIVVDGRLHYPENGNSG